MSESSGSFSCKWNGTNPNSPISIPSIFPAIHSDSESDSIPGSNESLVFPSAMSESSDSFSCIRNGINPNSPISIPSIFPANRSDSESDSIPGSIKTYPEFSHNSNSIVSCFPPARSPTDSTESYEIIITNPSITKTSSFSLPNGPTRFSIPLVFPPIMSETETDGSCSESSQSSHAQFSNSIVSLLHSVTIKLAAMNTEMFESRKLSFQQIMEALHDDNSKRIGLHGIGGIGKTTLVKEVHKKTNELNIFDEIVMTVVSLTPNVRRIQDEIAGCLNLKLYGESNMARASQICLRIKKAEKILIILDDVGTDVNLEAIGIPSCDDHRGCKMLLTTRSVQICNLMRCQRKIPLNFLVEEESLALMKKIAIVDDCQDLNDDVVLEVVKECKGLPIAITTVGKALAGKSLNDWKVAMHQIRKSRLVDIEGVDEDKNAYACLKWSFDQLKRKTKLCFLLCSLFPEDCNIPIEELTRYAVGLEEDEDFHFLVDIRSQVCAAINSLKDSSLLLEGSRKEFVKMHDMVRAFGLWITSKGESEFKLRACTRLERNTNLERATAISFINYNTKQLPNNLVCPGLNILLLHGIQSFKEISNALFEGMNCLKVLKLHGIILSSQSLELLTNLRTLFLEGCDFRDDLSSLGKLKRLETLRLHKCGMVALPSELGEMESLKILDLTDCNKLKQIPPNVIRRLSQLEELFINGSFNNWDVEGATSEISNANLTELNSLPRLVILCLMLEAKNLPKGFVFPDLYRYFIVIGKPFLTPVTPWQTLGEPLLTPGTWRTLVINGLNASSMNALKSLFHTVEYIWIESCEMECIVDTTGGNHTATLGNLVGLHLMGMSCLRTICEGPNQYEIFSKLTVLVASGCPRLISLFSPSLAQSLKKLKELSLHRCHEMKQIISEEEMILESRGQPICLSKLETLVVENCGKLEYIFPISFARGLQQLKRLKLRDLPRLKKVFGQNREGEVGDCEIESHHQPTGFPKLKTIEVVNSENLEYIFPISIARDLPQLESLSLKDLPQLKQVFGHEEGGDDGDGNNSVLSKLRKLRLKNLPELVSLCEGNSSSVWPSLKRLEVANCPMSFFANVEANVPALQKVAQIDEPTGTSTISPVLTICPANNDITWTDDEYDGDDDYEDEDCED